MVDFNSDIPQGKPKLDNDYWKSKKDLQEDTPVFDTNIKATFTSLENISIFKNK